MAKHFEAGTTVRVFFVGVLLLQGMGGAAVAQKPVDARPWMDASLPAEQRAEMVLSQMTLEEKIAIVHGEGMAHGRSNMPPAVAAVQSLSAGGAGLVLTPQRLGIPLIQMSDAADGVRDSAANGRYSTA